jgi:uncharacterized damage-inducible protein DinB
MSEKALKSPFSNARKERKHDMTQVAVEIHRQVRSSILTAVEGLSAEQLHAMPDGYDNNIAWNLGHIMVVQQRILYGSCGLPLSVSEEMIPLYLPNTSPADWQTTPDAEALVAMLMPQQEQLEEDYAAGRFSENEFSEFRTRSGLTLGDLDSVLTFNIYHESQHYGFILALINLVG